MCQAVSQAWSFYREAAESKKVWTVRNEKGFAALDNLYGTHSMPFWSSLPRVQRIIKTVPGYACYEPCEISWEDFCQKWVPDLQKDGLRIGVNWSGPGVIGHDLEPEKVMEVVEAVLTEE